MELRLISETATTITLGWDPVPGADGYRFYADDKAVSRTFDPERDSIRFAKGATQYRVVPLHVPEDVENQGVWPEAAPAPATAIPTYRLHVKPNYYIGYGDTGYRNVTLFHESPTTQFMTQAGSSGFHRCICTPDAVHPDATKKSWVWWFAQEIMIDPSFDPTQQGQWGTAAGDYHNVSIDVGNTGSGGVGWGFGAGTSSVQYDYIGGTLYQHLQHGTPQQVTLIANAPKGVWHSILTKLTLGRTDGSITDPAHPYSGQGRMQSWVNGASVAVDSGPTNTLQRATNPANGIAYTQTIMSCWEPLFYTKYADTIELIFSGTATRIGRTLSECLADTPTLVGSNVATTYDGSGVNLGPSYFETLTGADARTTASFKLPSPLPA